MGASFISAMFGNYHAEGVCIDNWSEFGSPRMEFYQNLWAHLGQSRARVTVIDEDCFRPGLLDGFEPFDVYLYDGFHDQESHRRAIADFWPYLADVAIIVIDDWNFEAVEKGTMQGLSDVKDRLVVRDKYVINYSHDNKATSDSIASQIFWNGMAVFVVQKLNSGN